jgi:hypothetical protein
MAAVLSESLLAHARRLALGYEATVLAMQVDSEALAEEVLLAATEVVGGLAVDEVFWSVDLVRDAVVIRQWGYTPDVIALLHSLATGLGARGIAGELSPWPEPERVPDSTLLTEPMELLECHLRVNGERRIMQRQENIRTPTGEIEKLREASWFPDLDAWLGAFDEAFEWFSDAPGDAIFWGQHPSRRLIGLQGLEEVTTFLTEAHSVELRTRGSATVWWQTQTGFRMLMFQGTRDGLGDMSLVEGGSSVASDRWKRTYQDLLGVLRRVASCSPYGYIKRGRHPGRLQTALNHDWLPQAHYGRNNLGHFVYEDVLAPDIFGAQLLGVGYAGRVRPGADWRTEELGPGVRLVTHRNSAAWFGRPLPPLDEKDLRFLAPGFAIPKVVTQAREEFADILITPEIVRSGTLDPLSA